MDNKLKGKLFAGGTVIGPFMKLPSPALVEIIGNTGFDFVIIDCEHGPLDVLAAEDMIRAAHLVGMSAVIRVQENSGIAIDRALDVGADAVQVPQISCREDAEKVVRAAKFAPFGERGVCRYVRAAKYSAIPKSEYFEKANEETMTIIHIEGLEGIRNIDEIMEVEGIDVIFLGPYDLSQSLGIPGKVDDDRVKIKMREVIEKAKTKGKCIGTFADDIETSLMWMSEGVKYISYSVDVGIIYDAMKKVVDKIHVLQGK